MTSVLLPLTVLGSWLLRQGIDLALLHQLQISLFCADSFQLGVQCHAVAVCSAQVTAVLVCIRIEAQVIFPRPVVVTEGAARLDLLSPQRPGVEDEPTPSGRFHDGYFIVNFDGQTGSPPSGCFLLHADDRVQGPYLQCRSTDALGHDDLARRTDVGKVVYRLHVVHEHRGIAAGQTLHQLGDLHKAVSCWAFPT